MKFIVCWGRSESRAAHVEGKMGSPCSLHSVDCFNANTYFSTSINLYYSLVSVLSSVFFTHSKNVMRVNDNDVEVKGNFQTLPHFFFLLAAVSSLDHSKFLLLSRLQQWTISLDIFTVDRAAGEREGARVNLELWNSRFSLVRQRSIWAGNFPHSIHTLIRYNR